MLNGTKASTPKMQQSKGVMQQGGNALYFDKLETLGEKGYYPVILVCLALGITTRDWTLPAYVVGIHVAVVWLAGCYFGVMFVRSEGFKNLGIFFHNCASGLLSPVFISGGLSYFWYFAGYGAYIVIQKVIPSA